MAEIDHHDPDRDYPLKQHSIEAVGGQKINLKREGPFNWWYLSLDKGPILPEFTGAYTSYSKAYEAALRYASIKKLVLKNGPDLAVTEKEKKREKAMKSIVEI